MKFDICIIGGAGHVGLPLGIVFAASGQRVAIYDINAEALRVIESGVMPFKEAGADALLRQTIGKTLTVHSDPSVISESRFIIATIGTPIDEHLNPRFSQMKRFLNSISGHLRDGHVFILRSTVYPGTSEKVKNFIDNLSIKAGVSFCPERIAEGNAIHELTQLPQIVSAFDADTLGEVKKLFRTIASEIVELDPIEAELAKLFTNTWRYILFSITNQFYMLSEEYGLDYYKIHNAMLHNYARCSGLPKPGLTAGPCLLKDTMQLAAFNRNNFLLGHSAMLINEGLPNFIVGRLKGAHDLSKMCIGVLGMGFKAESDDPRDSLSYKLKKLFEFEAREVLCSDPYVADDKFVGTEELVARADLIVLAIPHKEYAALDYRDKPVVDIWNILGKGGRII